ncbi:MAG: DUF3987 domain-containing protein [Prevotella sp.]|nr:DUF3987 domain-containing protein [Prevotella sp.]
MSFGIANSVKGSVKQCTPDLLAQAMDAEVTKGTCAEIEDALEKVKRGEMSREDFETFKGEHKKRLPIITPHAMFPKGRRCNGDAVASGLSMYDIDHISDPRGYYQTMVADRVAELGIVLAHVTPSLEGLRLIFVMPQGMTLEEAQLWMSQQLGDANYDGCVKDMARSSFVVPRSYVLYMDEEELFNANVNVNGNETAQAPTKREQARYENEDNKNASKAESSPCTGGTKGSLSFKGIPYSEIIAEYWKRTGGEPEEGERNVKLHKLAANLRSICDNRQEVLMQVMPRLGLSEQELQGIINSACKEPAKGSKVMDSIVESMTNDNVNGNDSSLFIPHSSLKKMPLGLKESLVGVPKPMQMPVLCAVMPIAAAYADQVEVEYCDGTRMKLGLMSIIRGEQASGKSVCKNAVDVWKRQLEEEDALARKREEEWKEKKKARKANEKAPDDPKVLIRTVPVTVSCSTLLKRMKNSRGHTLYSFGEELDTLRKTNGAGSWSSKDDIYRLSFDQGEWGQDYNSDQAESGMVKVAYNWTMLGTNGALRKCFKQDNIENGLSSRMLISEMPDSAFQKMPKYGKRSDLDEQRIQEAVSRLRSCTGFIDTPRLRKAIEKWVEQKRVEAAKDIDRVKDTYRKRAAVIGFRCGVIHYLLEQQDALRAGSNARSGELVQEVQEGSKVQEFKEGKGSIDFALMMAQYALDQQISAFGEALEKEYVDARSECQRYGANHSVFDQLPPAFTLDDLAALKRNDLSRQSLLKIILRWKNDGWVEQVDKQHWKKEDNKTLRQ